MATQYRYDEKKKTWVKVTTSTPSRGETNRNGRSSASKSGTSAKTTPAPSKPTTPSPSAPKPTPKPTTGTSSSSRTYSRGETNRNTTTSTPRYNTYDPKSKTYSYDSKNSTTGYKAIKYAPGYKHTQERDALSALQKTWDDWMEFVKGRGTEESKEQRGSLARAGMKDLDTIDTDARRKEVDEVVWQPGAKGNMDFTKFQAGKDAYKTKLWSDNVAKGIDSVEGLSAREKRKAVEAAQREAKEAGNTYAIARARDGDFAAMNDLTGKAWTDAGRAGRMWGYDTTSEVMQQQVPEEMRKAGTTPVDIPADYGMDNFDDDRFVQLYGEHLDGSAATAQERQEAKQRLEMVTGIEDVDTVTDWSEVTFDPSYLQDLQTLNRGTETYQDMLDKTGQYGGDKIAEDMLVLRDHFEGHVPRSQDEVIRAANRVKAATGVDVLNAADMEAAFDQAVQTNDGLREAVAQAVYKETGKMPVGADFDLDDYMAYMQAYMQVQNNAMREEGEQLQFDDTIQQKYGEYYNAPDFASKSQPVSLGRAPANEAEAIHQAIVAIDDPELFERLVDPRTGMPSAAQQKYTADTISPEQRNMYHYIRREFGEEAAMEYLDDIDWSVRKAIAWKTEEVSKQLSEGVDEEAAAAFASGTAGTKDTSGWSFGDLGKGAGASLASILSAPARAAVVPFNTIRNWMGQEIDQYDPTFNVGRASDAIRQNVGQNLDELLNGANIAGWNIGSGVYQGLMSVADNWMLYGLGPNAGSAIMGMEAGDTAMRNALANGRSQEEALRDAYVTAGIEGVTEKMGMDKLFGDVGNPLKYVVSNALAEAGEEVSSEIMNMIYDTAMYGDDSDLGRLRAELITKGYLKGDLNWQLIKQVAGQLRDAGFGGFIGGAGGATPNATVTAITDASAGKNLQKNEAAQSLLDFAGKMLPEGDVRNMASELMGAIKEGGKVANSKLGRVYRELLGYVDEHTRQVLDGTMARNVREQLREMGVDAGKMGLEIGELTDSILRIVAGDGSAHPIDYITVGANDAARAVAKSLTDKIDYAKGLMEKAGEFVENAGKKKPAPEAAAEGERVFNPDAEEGETESSGEEFDFYADEADAGIEFEGMNLSDSEVSTTSDGEEVSVDGVESVGTDGEMKFKVTTADGTQKTVSASEVSLGTADQDTARLAAYAKEYGTDAASMFNARMPSQDVKEYAAAFGKAVQYGRDGRNIDSVSGYDSVKMLNPNQLGIAYEIGRAERNMRTEMTRQHVTEKMTANGPVKVGMVDVSQIKSVRGLNKHQRRSIVAMRNVAELLGINIVFTESAVDERGRYQGAHGSWNPSTLTLSLDIHAGSDYANDLNYAMMHTAGHELTHTIYQFADAEIRDAYQDFVLSALGNKMTEDKLEARIQEYIGKPGVKNRDAAIEEIVAEASVEAFSKITESDIRQLAEENYPLVKRIANQITRWVSNMKRKIAKAFAGTEAKNEYAKMMNDQLDELAEKWNAALVNAVRNKNTQQWTAERNQTEFGGERVFKADDASEATSDAASEFDFFADADSTVETTPTTSRRAERLAAVRARHDFFADVDSFEGTDLGNGDFAVDATNEVKFSLRENENLMDKAAAVNDSKGNVDDTDLQKAAEDRAKVAAFMRDDSRGLHLPEDLMGNTFFSDAAYGGTEENTTVCPRSIGADAFLDAVSDSLGRPLTVAEQVHISQDIIGAADIKDPQCIYCYVAADRAAYREFLGKYIDQRDSVIKALQSGETDTEALYDTFLNGRKPTKEMRKRFDLWVNTFRQGKKLLSKSDLANIGVLTAIQSDKYRELSGDPNFAEQMKDALKYAQAASWAKKRVNYVAYNGHILKWKPARIKKLNDMYGLRMYSFSDFSPAFALENMQMVTDAAVQGLKMLAYTKVPAFAEIFADTGMNINVSVFATEVKGDNGSSIVENNLMGADWKSAQKLRSEHENVGITFVATSDAQIEWALDQDWIDVVIPYHLVRTGRTIAEMMQYRNYTAESGDSKKPEWSKGAGNLSSIPAALHNNDRDTYMRLLEENNLEPRFARFVDHPNYMKLVNETRQSVTTSKPVQPIFNVDAAINALQDMANNGGYYVPIGGSEQRMYELANEFAGKVNRGEYQESASESEFANDGKLIMPSQRFDRNRNDIRYQLRDPDRVSDRELLANMMDSAAENQVELDFVRRYRSKIAELDQKQAEYEQARQDVADARKSGARKSDIAALENKAKILGNQLDRMDGQLLKFEAGKPLQAVVKRQREELRKKASERMQKRVAEVRRQEREKYDKLDARMEELRQKKNAKIEELKREKAQKVKEVRDEKNESFAKQKYRKRLEEDIGTLRTWVTSPTNKEHVPQFMRKPLGDMIASLDFSSVRRLDGGADTQKDQKLKDALDAMNLALMQLRSQQDGLDQGAAQFATIIDLPFGYNEEFTELVAKIKTTLDATRASNDIAINRMTSAQLKALSQAIRTLTTSIRQMNRLLANAKYESAVTAANNTMDSLDKMTAKKDAFKLTEAVGKFMDWTNTVPYYAFKRFGEGGKAIFSGLMDGWDKLAFNSDRLVKFTDAAYTTKEVKKWAGEMHSIQLDSGDTVRMTTAQLMSLYCLSKRAQAVGHLMGGGIRIADIESKGKRIVQSENYTLTQNDLQTFADALTARQREVADKLQEFMSTQGAEWGNEISMKRFGYEMFTEAHYFPIETDSNNRRTIDEQAQENSLFRLLNMSATKGLVKGANNAIVVRDIFDVFTAHSSDMAKYNALGLQILDAMKWLNYVERTQNDDGSITTRSVQKSLERAYGTDARKYILNLLRDLNGTREGGRNDGLINKVISNAKVASVAANVRVYLLQATSMPRAAYAISPAYLSIGMAKMMANPVKAAKTAIEKVGIAKWKSMGFYDTNISGNIREMVKHDQTIPDKIREASMAPAGWFDNMTMATIYYAAEAECAKKYPNTKKGSATWDKLVNDRVRDIVYQTQVVDSTMTRSDAMRGKGIVTLATAFMSEPTLAMNMLSDAIYDARMKHRGMEDIKAPTAKMAKAIGVFTVTAVLTALMESLFDAERDDDEFETFSEKYMAALIGDPTEDDTAWQKFGKVVFSNIGSNLNVLNNIPLVSSGMSIVEGFSDSTMYTQFLESFKGGYDAYNNWLEGKGTAYNWIYKALQGVSQAIGLPVSNVTREVASVWNTFFAEKMGWKRIQTYANTEREAAKAIFKAQQAGDTERVSHIRDRAGLYSMDEEKINSAIAKLAEDAYLKGDMSREAAAGIMTSDGGKRNRQAEDALVKADYQRETGLKHSDMKDDFIAGVLTEAKAREYLKKYDGLRKDDIDDRILEWKYEQKTGLSYSSMKQDYLDGELTDSEVMSYRTQYGGAEKADVEETLGHWQYEKDTGLLWSELKDDYADGVISETKLRDYLKVYGGKDEEEVEEKVSNYDFQIATGRTSTAPKYWRIAHAAETGGDYGAYIDEAFQKIMYGGEKRKTQKQARSQIASSLASYYKYYYLPIAGTAEGNAMLERILDVYEAIGYSRSYEREYIAENWFE